MLKALFVIRMVVQGKATMEVKHLMSMIMNMTTCWVSGLEIRAVKGVAR